MTPDQSGENESRQRINDAALPASPPQYDDIIASAEIHSPNPKNTEMNQKPIAHHLKSKVCLSDSGFNI